jgi:hypothetical protein
VRKESLTRLRLAFTALGLLLVLPLVWLLVSFDRRLEAQRRVRHEVVAERIFDEVERELTLVLNEFAEQPSVTDGALPTAADRAPYVLGFYVREGNELRGSGVPNAEPERQRRWAFAFERVRVMTAEPPKRPAPEHEVKGDLEKKPPGFAAEPRKASGRSPAEVLRSLNRADEYRSRDSRSLGESAPAK